MDQLPVPERLPGLYRAVLDAVASLETRGQRGDAAAIREQATRAYSGAWNEAAARRLQALRVRADRVAQRHVGRGGAGVVLRSLPANEMERTSV